jgi:Uncharacterized protein conserved in bacteria (DUF2330)
MRELLKVIKVLSLVIVLVAVNSPPVRSACCYFSAKGKDVLQPAQKAFITWDPVEQVESFTVQPKFEGNASDFGMVIPTPSRPKLDEMPRDFFKLLAVFTILEPMDMNKYKRFQMPMSARAEDSAGAGPRSKQSVRVLEAGIVGSLDYKIIVAERADDLFAWLRANRYSYAGDQSTLDFYIKKGWFFTVMKIDPLQMKRNRDGAFEGEITPTRFTFASDKLIYPLRITQISVKDTTEALFYIQAPYKMDLPGDFSYQFSFCPMWSQAASFAVPEMLTPTETAWQKLLQPKVNDFLLTVNHQRQMLREPATLEWAKKIRNKDIAVLSGIEPFNRQAPSQDIEKLKLLKGHLRKGLFVTKMRKIFTKAEMSRDLEFIRARINGQDDNIEYFSMLPTSPP